MRTVKWNPFLSGACVFLGAVLLWAGAARADVSSTNPAAIVVFPKLLFDATTTAGRTDTVIELTNTAPNPVNVRCFLVNANGHCSNSTGPGAARTGVTTGFFPICDPNVVQPPGCGVCVPSWIESDFRIRLTAKQPLEWTLGDGLPSTDFPLPAPPGVSNSNFNEGSIPPAPEDPMIGELKCIEVDDNEAPTDQNDLKGEATIEFTNGATPFVDIEGYNAIGIQAIAGQNNGDNTLVIGQEYNSCPGLLVLDHFFDDAIEPALDEPVRTALTLVPCSEDFNLQLPITTTVQYLVFNEFEQRFSTSNRVTCFSELPLSDIDTRLGPHDDANSIFNVGVEGTLTGQTLIRGVADSDQTHGHGLLGVAEEFHDVALTATGFTFEHSAAFMLHQRGTRTQTDIIQLPDAAPPAP